MECVHLISILTADFPKHLAYIATHNHTVNMEGKAGRGKPIDQMNECKSRDSPDEFSVAPVIMKDAECSLVDNLIAEKLILPTFRPNAPVLRASEAREKDLFYVRPLEKFTSCLLYTSPSPRDQRGSRMPSSA